MRLTPLWHGSIRQEEQKIHKKQKDTQHYLVCADYWKAISVVCFNCKSRCYYDKLQRAPPTGEVLQDYKLGGAIMPNKMDKELKRKFGAYLKVAILNAKKEYLIGQTKIIKTETSLDEVDSIEDKAAERMLENVCIDYKIKDGEEFHARDVLNSIDDPTLYSAISALNTLQIEILVLRCIGKKTFREIGKLVGRSELQAKNIYFNTLTKLRKIIGEK